ncbi:BRO-N domain-containing protein [Aphanothece hegewaldii]|uniref:BRO-N domain-containing protein n=1 Tax=Aphanothece hegewaldii TaxID=1521625 RepID=UPI0015E76F71|nr:BRO family protein [Aphanothece hegewaldii]
MVHSFPSNVFKVAVVGEPWFKAKDVLSAIRTTTTVTAVETLVSQELGKEFVNNQPLETQGGIQELLVLSEAALTFFVSRSRTELGKQLNRWMHTEVLPAIRKTGYYSATEQKPQPMSQAEALLQSVRLIVEIEKKVQHIERERFRKNGVNG